MDTILDGNMSRLFDFECQLNMPSKCTTAGKLVLCFRLLVISNKCALLMLHLSPIPHASFHAMVPQFLHFLI